MRAVVISSDNRSRLIQAATEAFLEEGYRVSVDRIAARAGVAKQTLYNHFTTKDELLGEVARSCAESTLIHLQAQNGDLRPALLSFAAVYRSRALSDSGLAMFRSIIGEAAKVPDLARSVFVKGTDKTAKGLAAFLERAMAAGKLRSDDSHFAADMLMGMLMALDRPRRLAGQRPLSAKAESARIERIVDCFLRAFAP
jgi:TetR/AcrR family transcriptional repressor of mexJK operon